MKLDYNVDQTERLKEKMNSAKDGISKQMIATAAIKQPQPAGQAAIPTTADGFGRTV